MRSKVALLVAHPGHEIAVYGWLSRERPTVYALSRGKHGVDVARRRVEEVGARTGTVFGAVPEMHVYAALLAGDASPFIRLAEQLAAAFARNEFEMVVGDSIEGLSATHDVWRCVIDAAVVRARAAGQRLRNYGYTLFGHPARCPPELESEAIRITLNENEHARKLAAARADRSNALEVRAILERDASVVLADFPDLSARVAPVLAELGPEVLYRECLRPAEPFDGLETLDAPPLWELYGERLVERGVHPLVVRWHEHLVPVGRALQEWASSNGG